MLGVKNQSLQIAEVMQCYNSYFNFLGKTRIKQCVYIWNICGIFSLYLNVNYYFYAGRLIIQSQQQQQQQQFENTISCGGYNPNAVEFAQLVTFVQFLLFQFTNFVPTQKINTIFVSQLGLFEEILLVWSTTNQEDSTVAGTKCDELVLRMC
eukprot:TRINITY_DN5306_c2_g1_i1.p4 TRINITY_DN5306_c2_g1~~TRINITY_DN5306_c2_g1_i1.p4  ORF type:complete len:152 (+),score=5.19 TRINITY_DN5306_c2_g1_i1:429-884(+)